MDDWTFGLRSISAVLKAAGHATLQIHMTTNESLLSKMPLAKIASLLHDVDLIGVNRLRVYSMWNQKHQDTQTISNTFGRVRQLTESYHRPEKGMGNCLLQNEVRFVNQALRHAARGSTLLDICCGIGEVSQILQTTGFRTLELDLNWQAVATFRQLSQGAQLIQGDALHLPFWSGSIDVIIGLHCFDLLDRIGFLKECNRVLNYGGLLIFDTLNRHSYKLFLKKLNSIISPRFITRQYEKWINVFSFPEVLQLINLSGYDLLFVRGYGWPPFSADSNSSLVKVSVTVEKILHLDRFPHASPRVLMAVRKKALIGTDA